MGYRLLAGMMILMPLFGQEPAQEPAQADCEFFRAKHDRFVSRIMGRKSVSPHQQQVSEMTNAVAAVLPKVVAGSRTATGQKESTIDYYLFGAMQNAGVTPAASTNDYEFIRRVTLDLTGRIPTPDRVTSFVADNSADKRA